MRAKKATSQFEAAELWKWWVEAERGETEEACLICYDVVEADKTTPCPTCHHSLCLTCLLRLSLFRPDRGDPHPARPSCLQCRRRVPDEPVYAAIRAATGDQVRELPEAERAVVLAMIRDLSLGRGIWSSNSLTADILAEQSLDWSTEAGPRPPSPRLHLPPPPAPLTPVLSAYATPQLATAAQVLQPRRDCGSCGARAPPVGCPACRRLDCCFCILRRWADRLDSASDSLDDLEAYRSPPVVHEPACAACRTVLESRHFHAFLRTSLPFFQRPISLFLPFRPSDSGLIPEEIRMLLDVATANGTWADLQSDRRGIWPSNSLLDVATANETWADWC